MGTNVSLVSAISTEFLDDFIILYKSIRRFHDNHFILFVYDLNSHDMNILIRIPDIEIRILDFEDMPYFEINQIIWCKQFIFDHLHDKATYLWLDADIVVTSDISQVIRAAENNFMLFSDKFSPTACYNKKELYTTLKIDIKPIHEKLAVNSGVMGFNPERDVVILDTIKEFVILASKDDKFRSLIACYDQGCVLAAIHKLRLYYNVLDCDMVNVKPRLVLSNKIKDEYEALIKHIEDTNFGKSLLHYAGPFKASNYKNGSSKLKELTEVDSKNMGIKPAAVIITGLCEYHVDLVSNALACSVNVSGSVLEFNTEKMTTDAFYDRHKRISGPPNHVSLEEIKRTASENTAILNIIHGHRLVNRLEELQAIKSSRIICLVPSLHDFILYSLNDFSLYGDSLINYGEEYLSHYRSDGREHLDNLFKIHDMETEHIFDCYIKEYVDRVKSMKKIGVEIYMTDEFRSLYKIPSVYGLEKHIDIKSYNRLVREGEIKIKKFAKDEYLRLMRSYTRLPKYIKDFDLPLYKML